jgi:hypothetical protein
MRKLGRGQSVVFYVPPDVRQKICEVRKGHQGRDISIVDILTWSISETWADCERSIPLWATQGVRYLTHEANWDRVGANKQNIGVEDAKRFLEIESQTLEKQYSPIMRSEQGILIDERKNPDLQGKLTELERISAHCVKFGVADLTTSSMQEEQERELSIELQAERWRMNIERMDPEEPLLDDAVRRFVRTGHLDSNSPAFRPAFMAFEHTSAAELIDLQQFTRELLATEDFVRTVKPQPLLTLKSDKYQRPVQWVVTRFRKRRGDHFSKLEYMVILSPFEAGELYGDIRRFGEVTLHLYTPRTNLAFAPSDDLQLYNVPPFPRTLEIPRRRTLQLNLFAGQLYLRDYEEYRELCLYLDVEYRASDSSSDVDFEDAQGDDAFEERTSNPAARSMFTKSPLPFIRELMMVIRRDSRDIAKTDVGRILAGEILKEKYFEERRLDEEDDEGEVSDFSDDFRM